MEAFVALPKVNTLGSSVGMQAPATTAAGVTFSGAATLSAWARQYEEKKVKERGEENEGVTKVRWGDTLSESCPLH